MEPRAVFVGMQLNAKCINYGNCVKNGVRWSIVLHFALAEGEKHFSKSQAHSNMELNHTHTENLIRRRISFGFFSS